MPGVDLFTNTNTSSSYRGDTNSQPAFPTDRPAGTETGFEQIFSGSLRSPDDNRIAKPAKDAQPDAPTQNREIRSRPAAGADTRKPSRQRSSDASSGTSPSESRTERPRADQPDPASRPVDVGPANAAEADSEPAADSNSEPVEGAAPQQLVSALLATVVPQQPVPTDAPLRSAAPEQNSALRETPGKPAESLAEAPITIPSGLLPALQVSHESEAAQTSAGVDVPAAPSPVETEGSASRQQFTDELANAAASTSIETDGQVVDVTQTAAQPRESRMPQQVAVAPKLVPAEFHRDEQASRTDEQPAFPNSESRTAMTTPTTDATAAKSAPSAASTKPANAMVEPANAEQLAVAPETDAADDAPVGANPKNTGARETEVKTDGTSRGDAKDTSVPSAADRFAHQGVNPAAHAAPQNTAAGSVAPLQSPLEKESADADDAPRTKPQTIREPGSLTDVRRVDVAPKPVHAAGQVVHANPAHVIEQAAQGIQIAHRDGREMQVRLSPPELGALQIEISLKDGVISARLETQTAAAQQLLSDNLQQLKESLSQQGLSVDRLDVFVGQQHSGGNLAQNGEGQNSRDQAFEGVAPWETGQPKPAAPASQRGGWSVDRSLVRGPLKQLDVVV
jgi:flagellar hook-length control protein FliK